MSASAVPSSGSVGWPASRRRAKTSRAAKTVTTRDGRGEDDAADGQDHEQDRDEDRGADAPARAPLPRLASEPALASGELEEGRVERGRPEVGPEGLAEVELGVGRLPDEEVREALLAAGPDHEVGVGQAGRVQDAG